MRQLLSGVFIPSVHSQSHSTWGKGKGDLITSDTLNYTSLMFLLSWGVDSSENPALLIKKKTHILKIFKISHHLCDQVFRVSWTCLVMSRRTWVSTHNCDASLTLFLTDRKVQSLFKSLVRTSHSILNNGGEGVFHKKLLFLLELSATQ